MTGIQEYNQKYLKKIEKLVDDDAFLKKFAMHMQIDDISLSTIYEYLNCVKRFIRHTEKQSININNDDFSYYLSSVTYNENGELFSAAYRISIYQALKKYGDFLVEEQVLECNPMNKRKRPHMKESHRTLCKRENGYLSIPETQKMISNIQHGIGTKQSILRQREWKERDLSIVLVFLNTGIRCSALHKLDVNDVDIEKGTVIVNDKGGKTVVKQLSDDTLTVIKQWLSKRRMIIKENDTEALFISNQKKRLSQRSISYIIEKYAADIKHISPHKLRATYGTQLYNETKDIHFVQKAMGHSTPAVTQIYIRGDQHVAEKASDIMENLLKTCEN